MTDEQFEKIKKGLQFHSEGGIDNLCTITETTLRTIIEDAIKEIEKENVILKKEVQWLDMAINYDFPIADKLAGLEKENAELKDDNKVMADNYSKMEQKFFDNLTKAKELLKRYVPYRQITDSKAYKDLAEETEQFLKE